MIVESFDNLSIIAEDRRSAETVITAESAFVKAARVGNPTTAPADPPANMPSPPVGGLDGDVLTPNTAAFEGHIPPSGAGGIFELLDRLDILNLLAVPGETTAAVIATLQKYCRARPAFCIVDSAENATLSAMQTEPASALTGADAPNSALYFPWVMAPDPLQEDRIRSFPPSGFVAGIHARTDGTRGVWKAPAGSEASVRRSRSKTSAKTSSSRCTARQGNCRLPTRSTGAGCRNTRPGPTWMPMPMR